MLEVGTPIWSNGFGCVTWVNATGVGVALLAGGEPKVTGVVLPEQAEFWAKRWLDVKQEDGQIEEVA